MRAGGDGNGRKRMQIVALKWINLAILLKFANYLAWVEVNETWNWIKLYLSRCISFYQSFVLLERDSYTFIATDYRLSTREVFWVSNGFAFRENFELLRFILQVRKVRLYTILSFRHSTKEPVFAWKCTVFKFKQITSIKISRQAYESAAHTHRENDESNGV